MYTIEEKITMRDKNVAAVFAFFLGSFGVHKFYMGKVGQGVLYAVFAFTFIPFLVSMIDFIRLVMMTTEEFDELYNSDIPFTTPRSSNHKTTYRKGKTIVFDNKNRQETRRNTQKQRGFQTSLRRQPPVKQNAHFLKGQSFFEKYQYRDAKVEFELALTINTNHPEILFHLACCNSLLEEKEALFTNLQKAIAGGFKDFQKIKNTDALAFLRIQKEYDQIAASGFKDWPSDIGQEIEQPSNVFVEKEIEEAPSAPLSTDQLLAELKKLGEMRQKGQITDAEFFKEKQKLFG